MYGDCKTSITRRMMMVLYGVMHYFDCQRAMLIYNGRIMADALQVAEKLGIQLAYLDQHRLDQLLPEVSLEETADTFNTLWHEIRQLEGKTIINNRGTRYDILKVTDGDITYTNQNGKRHRESADLFRRILSRVQSYGSIQQSQLRGEFGTYASAFISTVFANIPSCKVILNPTTIMII